jgi:hypothetical protein
MGQLRNEMIHGCFRSLFYSKPAVPIESNKPRGRIRSADAAVLSAALFPEDEAGEAVPVVGNGRAVPVDVGVLLAAKAAQSNPGP